MTLLREKRMLQCSDPFTIQLCMTLRTRQGPVKKPKVICEYNHSMEGVEKVDQQLVDYPIPRKQGEKCCKTVFHLMDIAVWNVFLLHQEAFTQS